MITPIRRIREVNRFPRRVISPDAAAFAVDRVSIMIKVSSF
jgi:hypothetical protein